MKLKFNQILYMVIAFIILSGMILAVVKAIAKYFHTT